MSYILMMVQEEGSEMRVDCFDDHVRGFDSPERAASFIDRAKEQYPEAQSFWVERLRDAHYWTYEHGGTFDE